MELRHLRYFVAVAEEMNIHRAAERLHISQPPLSVTIKQLEEELGVDLFDRQGRGIQITRAGEGFLVKARNILKDVGQACSDVKDINDGKVGTIKIGFISSSVTGILQNLVTAHRKKYPNVIIEMRQFGGKGIIDGLQNNELDVGIERLPIYLPENIVQRDIVTEGWCLAIHKTHPLAKRKQIKISDLIDEPLVFYPRWNSPASYDDVMRLFEENKIVPNIVQEAPEQMTIAALVASGMGIGIVPACMASIKVKDVVHRPIVGTKNRTGFTLISRKEEDVLVGQFLSLAENVSL